MSNEAEHSSWRSLTGRAWFSIDRMLGIKRPSIRADMPLEASQIEASLIAAMASGAKRLKLSQEKLIPITAVWLDMISNCCWRHSTALQAQLAERLSLKLKPRPAMPAA